MVKKELIKMSPLRILEKSSHGGVSKGNIGVIAAKKGVGKTACLIHIATDQLFQNKHVIHVSFSGNTQHIISWYEDIFSEISKRRTLESAMEIHDEIIKNRIIMNFIWQRISIEEVAGRIRSIIKNSDYKVDYIIVDGYNFYEGSREDLIYIKNFAVKEKVVFWFSASLEQDAGVHEGQKIPSVLTEYLDLFEILICLRPAGNVIHLELVKDHDEIRMEELTLTLDPKTLLITGERK
ncbi:MAG: hypothetical protein JXB88_14855 [Spirochaetales bacterium]|nr:hypothetical protein [Spirochaetales bacterium]